MTAEQITTVLTNILTGGGIILFLRLWIRGLKKEIAGLQGTISAQDQTLQVMEKRIAETEKMSDLYKGLVEDYPAAFQHYKTFIVEAKDEIIRTQREAIAEKDEQLAASSTARLKQLDRAEHSLTELPKLVQELRDTTQAIDQRFQVIAGATAGFSGGPLFPVTRYGFRGVFSSSLLDVLQSPPPSPGTSIEDDDLFVHHPSMFDRQKKK